MRLLLQQQMVQHYASSSTPFVCGENHDAVSPNDVEVLNGSIDCTLFVVSLTSACLDAVSYYITEPNAKTAESKQPGSINKSSILDSQQRGGASVKTIIEFFCEKKNIDSIKV